MEHSLQTSEQFFRAIKNGDNKQFNRLVLENRAHLYQFDSNHMSPIHVALRNNKLDLFLRMLKWRCPLDRCSIDNRTVIEEAILMENEMAVQYLFAAGASPWSRTHGPPIKSRNEHIKKLIDKARLVDLFGNLEQCNLSNE